MISLIAAAIEPCHAYEVPRGFDPINIFTEPSMGFPIWIMAPATMLSLENPRPEVTKAVRTISRCGPLSSGMKTPKISALGIEQLAIPTFQPAVEKISASVKASDRASGSPATYSMVAAPVYAPRTEARVFPDCWDIVRHASSALRRSWASRACSASRSSPFARSSDAAARSFAAAARSLASPARALASLDVVSAAPSLSFDRLLSSVWMRLSHIPNKTSPTTPSAIPASVKAESVKNAAYVGSIQNEITNSAITETTTNTPHPMPHHSQDDDASSSWLSAAFIRPLRKYHAGKNGLRAFILFFVFWSLIYAILFAAIYWL